MVADANAAVIGRTMELGNRNLLPLYDVVVVPRNSPKFCSFFTFFTEGTCDTPSVASLCPFLPNATRNSAGFVAINAPIILPIAAIGTVNIVTEGQNEHGLSISAQTLRLSQYQAFKEQCTEDRKYQISWLDFVPYLLGSFTNAPDAIRALRNEIVVTRPEFLEFAAWKGLHWSIDDAFGNHYIVEYLDNQLVVHESKLGVMTNDPSFSWHVHNLNWYANVQSNNALVPPSLQFPQPSNINPTPAEPVVPKPTSHGTGLLGLPGDLSPPSRFVRLFYLRSLAQAVAPPPDLKEALALTSSLLDSVAIPYGSVGGAAVDNSRNVDDIVRAEENTLENFLSDNTLQQWAVIKIPSKGLLYYRNYVNSDWKEVNLNDLDFSEGAPMKSAKVYNRMDAFGSPSPLKV